MTQNSLWPAVLILTAVNIFSFILVGVDKKRSRDEARRLPEVFLFFVAVFFASFGVFLGMYAFRHKTKKVYFPLGIGLLLIQQIFLLLYIAGY